MFKKQIFWKDGFNGKAKGGYMFRSFDLNKFMEKIESKENKAVVFDGSLEHSSTTCTDQHYRITLNINYEF